MSNHPVRRARCLSAVMLVLGLLTAVDADAFSRGTSGRTSLGPADLGCAYSGCHGGATFAGSVIFAPTALVLGRTVSFDFVVATDAAETGLDLASSTGVLAPGDAATRLTAGELVHAGPTVVTEGRVVYPFSWTAPASGDAATFAWCVLQTNANADGGGLTGDGPHICGDVAVMLAANSAPVVTNPGNQTRDSGAAFTLDMSATDANGAEGVEFTYSLSAAPAGMTIDAATGVITWPAGSQNMGTSSVSVRAVDLSMAEGSTTFAVTIGQNTRPVASAGGNQTVPGGANVTLDASNSRDVMGTVVSYAWVQDSADAVQVVLSDATAIAPTFTAPQVNAMGLTFGFSVTVTDDAGATDTARSIVNVSNDNQPPQANAGVDQTVAGAALATLDGGNSIDPDGFIAAFSWVQTGDSGVAVTLSDASLPQPTFTAPAVAAGTGLALEFTLTVTGSGGLRDSSSVFVNVSDQPAPVAAAGPDQTVTENTVVTLDGTASSANDGAVAAFAWTQLGGVQVTLSNADGANPTFTAPAASAGGSNLTFRLTVTDSTGLVASDRVVVTVSNTNVAPMAVPAAPTSATESDTVMLDGNASSDPDGSITRARWSQVSGPRVAFSAPSALATTFVAPAVSAAQSPALIVLSLTVVDNGGLANTAEFQIAVTDNGIIGFDAAELTLTDSVGGTLGLTTDGSADLLSVRAVAATDIAEQNGRPASFPIGLLDLSARVQPPGSTTALVIELAAPAAPGALWFKFSDTSGWTDFSSNATFNAERTRVTLNLTDGGAGDDDGVANGVIMDPSGLGIPVATAPPPVVPVPAPPVPAAAAVAEPVRGGAGCSAGAPGKPDVALLLLVMLAGLYLCSGALRKLR